MKYEKILIIYKKPLLEIYKNKSKDLEELMKERELTIQNLKAELEEYKITKKIVKKTLKKSKHAQLDKVYRADLSKKLVSKYDLIMPFGGDGTLFEAAHYITDNTPVFGINSDYRPDSSESSEGFLLSSNKHDFQEKYEQLQAGKLEKYRFNRLQAELNGKKLEELALNDIFVAHKSSPATSRMIVKENEIEEFQKNSGIIIATAASNWAIRAGGTTLPILSRKFQYVVRELYIGKLNPDPKLEKGITEHLEIYSKTREGIIAIDGEHTIYPFGLGSKLKIYPSKKTLTILGFDEEKRKHYAIRKKL